MYEYREERELQEEENWQVFARNLEILASIIFLVLNGVVIFFFFVPLIEAWIEQVHQENYYVDVDN